MYVDHFKLNNRPFIDSSATDAFLSTSESEPAITRIQHIMLARDGAAVVTGGPGVGKTTIIDQAAKGIEDRVSIARIDMRHTEPELLYQMVLLSLGAEAGDGNVADTLHRLKTAVRKENSEGRQVTAVIDINGFTAERANHILRLALLGGEADGQMNIILLGPHTLHKLLDIPGLIHIRQRVAYRYRVRPFTVAETSEYIEKQFESVKGKTGQILANGISGIVYQYVGGVPRLINTLMDAALSEAGARGLDTVSTDLVHGVAKELGWKPLSRGQPLELPTHHKSADDAGDPTPESREKPPILEVKAAGEASGSDNEDHPDNVKTGLIFEQPLDIQSEPEEELSDGTSINGGTEKSDNGEDQAPGEQTSRLLAAAESQEPNQETQSEDADTDDRSADESQDKDDTGAMPMMNADDTGATGMLKLEDLDARFAETVFGEDTGMVNALQELARMRGLDLDDEPEQEPKSAENK